MAIEQAQQAFSSLTDELNDLLLLDASDMFQGLIAYQSKLLPLSPGEYNKNTFVHGCLSNAYVLVEEDKQKAVVRGHADAMIIKGLMGVIAFGFSFLSIVELASNGKLLVQKFIDNIDLYIMLTPTRANAFGSVVQKIVNDANTLMLGRD